MIYRVGDVLIREESYFTEIWIIINVDNEGIDFVYFEPGRFWASGESSQDARYLPKMNLRKFI